jgi:glucan phosphoethanolaminetransferase (alkaline phosphatase superfamily)
MRISVKAETKKLIKHLNRIQRKQIPFATSKALNDVAFDARSFIQKSLPRKLDRPTKGITSSVQVQKSKKKNLVAIVIGETRQIFLRETEGSRCWCV